MSGRPVGVQPKPGWPTLPPELWEHIYTEVLPRIPPLSDAKKARLSLLLSPPRPRTGAA